MSKELGLISEMRFELAATLRGFTVSKPQGDNAPYDFILDTGGRLLRVQVKSSGHIDKHGRLNFNLKTGHAQHRSYTAAQVHFFALHDTINEVFYVIPQPLLKGYKTLKILPSGKFKEYKENWDFSPGKIRYERDERSPRSLTENG